LFVAGVLPSIDLLTGAFSGVGRYVRAVPGVFGSPEMENWRSPFWATRAE
jgi:hypothetical protein